MRSKPSLIVAKRDDISSIWSNGKATLMQKTLGNHVEMYTMLKKKGKTFTNNILTNQNPLLLIEESLSLQTTQSSTLSNQCSNSQHHHGDHDLKGGGNVTISKALAPKQAPTLSDITLSFRPFPISTLSFHLISNITLSFRLFPISPYHSTSFRTLVLLIAYP